MTTDTPPCQQQTLTTTPSLDPVSESLLIDARTSSRLVSVSLRHWMRLHAAGECPPAVRVGRCLRWKREDIVSWIACDCDVNRWAATRRKR
jgi:predicted DNA-binding transcriptional regulator AlpA